MKDGGGPAWGAVRLWWGVKGSWGGEELDVGPGDITERLAPTAEP